MPSEPQQPQPSPRERWRGLAWLFSGLLAFYALLVAPLDRLLPFLAQWRGAVALGIFAALAARLLLAWLVRNPAREDERLKAVVLSSAVVLGGALVSDTGFTAYENAKGISAPSDDEIEEERGADQNLWEGELSPDLYWLGRRDVVLFKPNQTRQGRTYGQFYSPALLMHPLLRDSVLEQRDITVAIDAYGFRNTEPPSAARVFLLGDSFVYGYHLTQKATAASVLGERLGTPVYNLGVFATSPVQQLQLLKHLLKTKSESFKPAQVFWFIFEANDLEDDYPPFGRLASPTRATSFEHMSAGTIVRWAADLPKAIRGQSILWRLGHGEIVLRSQARDVEREARTLDGQILPNPLYRSARFGPKFFNQVYIDRARKSSSYVRDHPNLPKLRKAIADMAGIARTAGFRLTLVTAPSGVRMYHREFKVAGVSEVPHFLRAVLEMAAQEGIDALDLSDALEPYARAELLYQRDDEHWNERANEIVAGLLAQHLANSPDGPLKRVP